MGEQNGTLVWFRRDLRLADHPALWAAVSRGWVVPVFILDDLLNNAGGAAARWRLSRSLDSLGRAIERAGGRLILRRGAPLATLRALIAETGATAVYWSRRYDAEAIEQDKAVKKALCDDGIAAKSFPGTLLVEPFEVETKTGGFYKVYTPFWRAVSADLDPGEPLPAPTAWPNPPTWPDGAQLDDLELEAAVNRGAAVLGARAPVGEAAAQDRLAEFMAGPVGAYHEARDRMDQDGVSRLSAHFATGELSPRTAWDTTRKAMARTPDVTAGAEVFLKELVWREFAAHLLFHTPRLKSDNWRAQWDAFPWRDDNAEAENWRRGRTGVPIVDAAMRQMYVTGYMHNRARMLTASYLTKNLLTHWKVGEAWFRDCLVDWDLASNAMGWQWAAGSGPDAAPYFRIFNPETQAKKFDPKGAYVARWLPEYAQGPLDKSAHEDGLAFFDACPRSWGLSPDDAYPEPALSLKAGRERALAAFENLSQSGD